MPKFLRHTGYVHQWSSGATGEKPVTKAGTGKTPREHLSVFSALAYFCDPPAGTQMYFTVCCRKRPVHYVFHSQARTDVLNCLLSQTARSLMNAWKINAASGAYFSLRSSYHNFVHLLTFKFQKRYWHSSHLMYNGTRLCLIILNFLLIFIVS